jgi:hypothetical protein
VTRLQADTLQGLVEQMEGVNGATASGACVRQQTSHELLDEMQGTKAYFRQFEHQDGTQWLPHCF